MVVLLQHAGRVHAIHGDRAVIEQSTKTRLGFPDSALGQNTLGNVAEVAHHALATIWQCDPVDLPLIAFGDLAVSALFNHLGHQQRLAGLQRVANLADGFFRLGRAPQDVQNFCNITANKLGN